MGQYGAARAARSGKTYWLIPSYFHPGVMEATPSAVTAILPP